MSNHAKQLSKGALYVISAPSGAGKTSLVKALQQDMAHVKVSISYTTRPMRAGEQNGVDYHFVQVTEFKKMLAEGVFLEYAEVFGNFYGTSSVWVEETRNQGFDVVLEIDWQGANQIKQKFIETMGVFILPLSQKVLLERLQKRHQDDEKTIESRMHEAKEHISHYTDYDYLIFNDQFHEALEDLKAIIRCHRLQKARQEGKWAQVIKQISS